MVRTVYLSAFLQSADPVHMPIHTLLHTLQARQHDLAQFHSSGRESKHVDALPLSRSFPTEQHNVERSRRKIVKEIGRSHAPRSHGRYRDRLFGSALASYHRYRCPMRNSRTQLDKAAEERTRLANIARLKKRLQQLGGLSETASMSREEEDVKYWQQGRRVRLAFPLRSHLSSAYRSSSSVTPAKTLVLWIATRSRSVSQARSRRPPRPLLVLRSSITLSKRFTRYAVAPRSLTSERCRTHFRLVHSKEKITTSK